VPDGPFRNQQLGSRATKFANAIYYQVESLDKCRALASDAILDSIIGVNRPLLAALRGYQFRKQLEFDPEAAIAKIFDEHSKSQFSNTMEREISYRINQQQSGVVAIVSGMQSACKSYMQAFGIRIEEAGLDLFHKGKMSKDQLSTFIGKCNEAMIGLDELRLFEAVRDGNKSEFARDTRKQTGVNEGPQL
jgi:hypothetical protein